MTETREWDWKKSRPLVTLSLSSAGSMAPFGYMTGTHRFYMVKTHRYTLVSQRPLSLTGSIYGDQPWSVKCSAPVCADALSQQLTLQRKCLWRRDAANSWCFYTSAFSKALVHLGHFEGWESPHFLDTQQCYVQPPRLHLGPELGFFLWSEVNSETSAEADWRK